jgi:rhodanese-related sulfurtransferase
MTRVGCLSIEAEWSKERSEWKAQFLKDLKAKLDKKQITLVGTLAPERYRDAHIPRALNIPPERMKELASQLLPNKDAEIVTYCVNTH